MINVEVYFAGALATFFMLCFSEMPRLKNKPDVHLPLWTKGWLGVLFILSIWPICFILLLVNMHLGNYEDDKPKNKEKR